MWTAAILLCLVAGTLATQHHHHPHDEDSSTSGSSSSASASSHASSSSHVKPHPSKCGPCPQITVPPVDFHKMSGPWYEIQRSANNVDGSDKCYKLYWSKPKNNSSTLTYKSTSNLKPITSTTVSTAMLNAEGTGFKYRFPTLGIINREHYILETVYDSYAVVWNCEMHGKKRVDYAWVFTRQQTPPCDIEAIKQSAFAKYDIPVPPMVKHDLSGCCEAFASYDFCH